MIHRCMLLVATTGCASYSSRLDATPLPPGAGELGVGLDVLLVERGRDHIPLPVPDVTYRRGVRPGVDAGGKVHLTGAQAGLRVAIAARGRLAIAWAADLALGYEPITNNTTDLVYARALPRLVGELRGRGDRPTWIAAAAPSLTFTGPVTMFRGIAGAARFVARPAAAFGARWRLDRGRSLLLEATAQPAYALGDGWLPPSYQAGAAVTF